MLNSKLIQSIPSLFNALYKSSWEQTPMIFEGLFKANPTLDKCGQVGLMSSHIANTSENLTKARRLKISNRNRLVSNLEESSD